jgi:hypothetical protein
MAWSGNQSWTSVDDQSLLKSGRPAVRSRPDHRHFMALSCVNAVFCVLLLLTGSNRQCSFLTLERRSLSHGDRTQRVRSRGAESALLGLPTSAPGQSYEAVWSGIAVSSMRSPTRCPPRGSPPASCPATGAASDPAESVEPPRAGTPWPGMRGPVSTDSGRRGSKRPSQVKIGGEAMSARKRGCLSTRHPPAS